MAEKQKRHHSSPRKARYNDSRNDKRALREKREEVARRRAHAERRHVDRTGCHNPEVRKGIGAVLCAVGVLIIIAGIVMTVVDATDNDQKSKYPEIFAVTGPLLITMAVICLIVGFSLSTPVLSKALHNCFSFDDPNSFCRVHFPRLSQFLKPDDTIVINRAAMKALQSEPSKSAMKRQPVPPSDQQQQQQQHVAGVDKPEDEGVAVHSGKKREYEVDTASLDVVSEVKRGYSGSVSTKLGSKGVRFSESDAGGSHDTGRPRTSSAGSSSDHGSVLSLKNCKVHPKNGIWWTESQRQSSSELAAASGDQLTTEL